MKENISSYLIKISLLQSNTLHLHIEFLSYESKGVKVFKLKPSAARLLNSGAQWKRRRRPEFERAD
jgi:hypothetical protein